MISRAWSAHDCKGVSMSVWAPWVPTWVVSIKITKKHDLRTGVENSIKLRRVNMIPRRLVNATT
ncbi:hypothetical protein TNCV_658771, partial [Trichonephila clavipes]